MFEEQLFILCIIEERFCFSFSALFREESSFIGETYRVISEVLGYFRLNKLWRGELDTNGIIILIVRSRIISLHDFFQCVEINQNFNFEIIFLNTS